MEAFAASVASSRQLECLAFALHIERSLSLTNTTLFRISLGTWHGEGAGGQGSRQGGRGRERQQQGMAKS